MKKEIKNKYITLLARLFDSAQKDLIDCWDNVELIEYLKDNTWIHSCDPETKEFCKMIYYEFSENVLTYFDIVKHIRISYNLNSLYYNIKADIAMKQIPDIGV